MHWAKVTVFVTWQSKSDPRRPRTACARFVCIYIGTGACTDMDSCGLARCSHNLRKKEQNKPTQNLHPIWAFRDARMNLASPQSRHTQNLMFFCHQCSWRSSSMQLITTSNLKKRFLDGIFSPKKYTFSVPGKDWQNCSVIFFFTLWLPDFSLDRDSLKVSNPWDSSAMQGLWHHDFFHLPDYHLTSMLETVEIVEAVSCSVEEKRQIVIWSCNFSL